MKIAICQYEIISENKEVNMCKACDFIDEAVLQGAELVLFPEMSFTGFSMNVELTGEEDFFTVEKMKNIARGKNIAIGFGWVEGKKSAKNHYTVVDENGGIAADYVKIHPFSYSGEDKYFEGGDKTVTFTYRGVCFGMSICYDLRFPEIYQQLSKEAHIILVPANWPNKRSMHWCSLLKARAIENQAYMIGINCCGYQGRLYYSGNTSIINPNGDVLYEIADKEEMKVFDFKDDVDKYRRRFPVKKDRKAWIYKEFY